nr:9846_t:CDS:2 [Entrophospora candida]
MPTEDAGLPFVLKRKQFPLQPAFSLTINKSQDQTLSHIGLYLPQPAFTNGQLYVAMSRVRKECNLKEKYDTLSLFVSSIWSWNVWGYPSSDSNIRNYNVGISIEGRQMQRRHHD